VVDAGGFDTIHVNFSYTLRFAFIEQLSLVGTGAINGTGEGSANIIVGNGAANLLTGLGGNDTLTGNDGADTLAGGNGDDLLNGGAGTDLFVIDGPDSGFDAIKDYRGAEDSVVLVGAAFGLATGASIAAIYVENTDGTPTAAGTGQFIFETDDQVLWWDPDGTGTQGPVALLDLTNATGWSVSEIVVI